MKCLSLVLILILAFPAQEALAQNNKPLTWTDFLTKIFGRRKQLGGSRGSRSPSSPTTAPRICPVTPVSISPVSISQTSDNNSSLLDNKSALQKSYLGLLFTTTPLIAWYGNVSQIQVNTINSVSQKKWKLNIPQNSHSSMGQPTLNQVQYSGEALIPDQDYELIFYPAKGSGNPLVHQYFTTLSQTNRTLIKQHLSSLAMSSRRSDPNGKDLLFLQVQYLLEQNLINDAQMLILQQTDLSPELKATIAAIPDPCIKKLEIPKTETK